jgi:HAMP domain-containing protein/HPt (histidine-containing phosphotransfer) domain-containing protein
VGSIPDAVEPSPVGRTGNKPRFALSIHQKLVALIVASMLAAVGFLAIYQSSQQIDAMTKGLRSKAKTYGAVMASQTTSAVAFSDRETAREVLTSVDADAEVASVVLYDADGVALYTRGTPTVAAKTALALQQAQVTETSSRIAVLAPVQSLEGPRGALVIELSTDALVAARNRIVWLAAITGVVALLGGAAAAWLLARRIARRLRAIASVATAVAEGDLSQQPVADRSHDEIGALSTAFNAMLTQIRELLAHVQEMARVEQARLETLVAERTAALDQRTREMQLVFDHVDQGLLIVDIDGNIASQRSAAVERWLGPVPTSGQLGDYVATFAPDQAVWFGMQWEALQDGFLPLELCLSQLPSRFEVGGRNLELGYQPLTDAAGALRVLVVVTDVTARVQREHAERDERETSAMVSRLLAARAAFLAFHAEVVPYLETVATGAPDDPVFRRVVHTLKGITALEGIDSISELCHKLETAIADGDEIGIALARRAIPARWELLTRKIAPLITAASGRVEVLPAELDHFDAAAGRGATREALRELVASWRHERVVSRLERHADDARRLAQRLGKGELAVDVDVRDDLRLADDRWGPFWGVFVHAIRNAIDHGIEPAADRTAAGRPESRLGLRARTVDDRVEIEIADNGRGIDWDRVAEVARTKGLPAATRADLEAALFADGVSTRDAVTETSGRGVGMAALRAACEASGGRIAITSEPGAGTRFVFVWPRDVARAEAPQPQQLAG